MTATTAARTARTHDPPAAAGCCLRRRRPRPLHGRRSGHVLVGGPGTSAGALVFVLSPLLLAVGLRTIGREGWADAGLRLGRERAWYAVALLLFPVLFAVPILLGALTGDVHVAPGAGRGSRRSSRPASSPA